MIEFLGGTSTFTKVLALIALGIVVGDFLATLFTIFYQRFFYPKIMRPKYKNEYKPFCSIIIPCKGIPKDLEDNLSGFFKLDYPKYEIVFVTESENDAAVPIIRKITEQHKNSSLVIAGLASTCAQKNHNLLAALEKTSDSEVLVFADSDIRPHPRWLHELIIPLSNDKVTVTTGFRWLRGLKGTLGELTHTYVNIFIYVTFTAACFFGGVGLWGGSMAIRRRDFVNLKVKEKWGKAAVDDMSLSEVVFKSHKKAVLVPPCLILTDDLLPTVKSTVSWFERQIMYLKAYQNVIWMFMLLPIVVIAFSLFMLLPVSLIGMLMGKSSFWDLGGGASLVFYIGEFLTILLYPLLGPMPHFVKFFIFQPFTRFTHIVSVFRTCITNTIIWAGIKYTLYRNGEVKTIER